jgi:hypothetical protein
MHWLIVRQFSKKASGASSTDERESIGMIKRQWYCSQIFKCQVEEDNCGILLLKEHFIWDKLQPDIFNCSNLVGLIFIYSQFFDSSTTAKKRGYFDSDVTFSF